MTLSICLHLDTLAFAAQKHQTQFFDSPNRTRELRCHSTMFFARQVLDLCFPRLEVASYPKKGFEVVRQQADAPDNEREERSTALLGT
ncbi:MAG TPA: hypothetical protein VF844_21040 [Ktedonobacteraceae bacterium]